jgi:hypothetical protein
MNSFPAATAEAAVQLTIHANPATSVAAGWKQRYQSSSIESIMKRVPMHEPWLLHENQLPNIVVPANTDRET